MGSGIAHVCALAGLPVVMLDMPSRTRWTGQLAGIGQATWNGRWPRRPLRRGNSARRLWRGITASTDYAAFAGADLVIEAATEREEVKHAIFRTLVPHLQARRP